MGKVIVTGGTGLVGRSVIRILEEKGYETAILTRIPKKPNEYQWDIERNFIAPQALDGAIAIIHLAGAGVADQAWTANRKQEIIDSRVRSAGLLFDLLRSYTHSVKSFISASAVGYYGDGGDAWLPEDRAPGTDFLAQVCRQWEAAADRFSEADIRVAKLRIGIVLSREGGALPKMGLPAHFGIGAYFGDGRQYMPWIHIEDLARLFVFALENEQMNGPYNACAPEPLRNKDMMRAIAKSLHRPFIPVPAPAIALKTILGERAEMLLFGQRCSAEKIQEAGYEFLFPGIDAALLDIYQNK